MTEKEKKFDKLFDTTDFSKLVEAPVGIPGRAGRKKIGRKIAITLPEDALDEIKELADEKSIGYQTLIRMMVMESLKMERRKKSA